jgi:hypothetical protein
LGSIANVHTVISLTGERPQDFPDAAQPGAVFVVVNGLDAGIHIERIPEAHPVLLRGGQPS